mgnify:CR=1 FL=1
MLDTNVAILWATDRRSLHPDVDEMLMSVSTVRLLSAVVPWEIAIKWKIGKLRLDAHPRLWTARLVRELALDPLPIDAEHVLQVADLPDHHRDPFDRLLIAQAQVEGIPIVTADRTFARYDVAVVSAV